MRRVKLRRRRRTRSELAAVGRSESGEERLGRDALKQVLPDVLCIPVAILPPDNARLQVEFERRRVFTAGAIKRDCLASEYIAAADNAANISVLASHKDNV